MQRWRDLPVIGTLRPIVAILIALMVLTPALMLALRIADPTRGQAPFGWQMHTTCWGTEDDRCR